MRVGIKVKIVNDALMQAILAQSENVAQFCKKHNLCQSNVGHYLNLKAVPIKKEICQRLEEATRVPIDVLFPPDLVEQIAKKPETRFYFQKEVETLSLGQVNQNKLTYIPRDAELEDAFSEALSGLTEREEGVLKQRFGFDGEQKTLDEVAKHFKVTKERVRQVEAKAIRKLKHPSRLKKLMEFIK